MDPDGTLHVTPPGAPTRTTRPATLTEADVQTTARSQVDTLLDLLGPIPSRYRTPTPAQQAARRAAATERAHLAAQIDADLDAALARAAAGLPLWPDDETTTDQTTTDEHANEHADDEHADAPGTAGGEERAPSGDVPDDRPPF